MSLQIFLYGRVLGIEEFLNGASGDLEGRAYWSTLLAEVLPRALLAELGLHPMLLGSSGGRQFLVVLPDECRARAEAFCNSASDAIMAKSGGAVRLVWSVTEDLGDWSDIRKRLLLELHDRIGAPGWTAEVAQPFSFDESGRQLREASTIGWSPEDPATMDAKGGKHTWELGSRIPFARHVAPDTKSTAGLASRAVGRRAWGVLRCDVDGFLQRMRRAQTAEEHLQTSSLYQQFFANELQIRCAFPEFFQRVTLLYADGQAYAVAGAWNALVDLAREIRKLFQIFVETHLKDFPGADGKTMSMALAIAQRGTTLAEAYAEAGDKLRIAKAAGPDSVWLFGRTLDWKQLADAAESKATMTRLVREFHVPRQLLDELAAFYRGGATNPATPAARRTNARLDRPWRFYRRLNTMLGPARGKEFQRLRSDLIADFTGRRASNVLLRPQGRVALEWAKLETETA